VFAVFPGSELLSPLARDSGGSGSQRERWLSAASCGDS